MLFLIEWSIPNSNRVACWNAFGNMTPADDLKDTGDHINVVGRWHRLGGSGGVCGVWIPQVSLEEQGSLRGRSNSRSNSGVPPPPTQLY